MVRQENSANNSQSAQTDTTQVLVSLGCTLLRILIAWAVSAAAKRIARRVDLLSQSTWIPTSGHGDTNAVAALMDMEYSGVKDFAKRRNLPVLRPGTERIYHFPDIVRDFTTPSDTDDQPENDLRPACAEKKPSTSARRKPRKK